MSLRLGYFAGETIANLRRNLLLTLAAISTVAVSLFLLGGMIVLGHVIRNVVGRWEGKVEVTVFLQDSITKEQNKDLETALTGMPEVEKVFYVSKDDAYKEYKEMFRSSPAIYENVDANALPASFRVKLHDPNRVERVRSRIEGRPGVDTVTFGGDVVKKLLRINTLLRTISLVMTFVLFAAATVLIANTIRLAIYARRREVGIMKLVGATNWFIRVPFIFEGMAEAALGAMAAGVVIFAAKILWLDRLQEFLVFLPLTVDGDVIRNVFVLLLMLGLAIGALGSSLALRRFLEV